MGSFGGFYKGEKKKKKKDASLSSSSMGGFGGLGSPVLTMPEILSKKKKPV